MPKPLVLLADDDDLLRQGIRSFLESEGFEVEEAADGQAALESMRSRPPALLLLDLAMPVLDGHAVLSQMQADPRLSQVPVVVLSASRSSPVGAASVLSKPFDLLGLVDEVRRHCRPQPGAQPESPDRPALEGDWVRGRRLPED